MERPMVSEAELNVDGKVKINGQQLTTSLLEV
jgi:hypothetical protein